MKNNLFDSYVKESLKNFRPEVPPHIWENIIAEKGRKKPFGFWRGLGALNIAAALLVTILASGTVYLLIHDKNPSEKNTLVKVNTGIEKSDPTDNRLNSSSQATPGNTVADPHNVSPDLLTDTSDEEHAVDRPHRTALAGNTAFSVITTLANNEHATLSSTIGNEENYLHANRFNIGVHKMNSSFYPRIGAMPSLSKSLFIRWRSRLPSCGI